MIKMVLSDLKIYGNESSIGSFTEFEGTQHRDTLK